MKKNIIWIFIIIALIVFGAYYRVYYPNSQLQLKKMMSRVVATPIEHFFNTNQDSCGIWYEKIESGNKIIFGKQNNKVKKCFEAAYATCSSKNILIVRDTSQTEKNTILYSLIRVVKRNDQNQCLIQNSFEEYKQDKKETIPVNYINTCTVLTSELYNSCEPQYIKEIEKQAKKGIVNTTVEIK